jgi:hypothetical protein
MFSGAFGPTLSARHYVRPDYLSDPPQPHLRMLCFALSAVAFAKASVAPSRE